MTGRELKEQLQILTAGFQSRYLDRNLLTEAAGNDLEETLNVLSEVIPPMAPEKVKQALTAEDGHSLQEIKKAMKQLTETATDEEYEEQAATLMDMLLTNLNLTGQIELLPSLRYRN